MCFLRGVTAEVLDYSKLKGSEDAGNCELAFDDASLGKDEDWPAQLMSKLALVDEATSEVVEKFGKLFDLGGWLPVDRD